MYFTWISNNMGLEVQSAVRAARVPLRRLNLHAKLVASARVALW